MHIYRIEYFNGEDCVTYQVKDFARIDFAIDYAIGYGNRNINGFTHAKIYGHGAKDFVVANG